MSKKELPEDLPPEEPAPSLLDAITDAVDAEDSVIDAEEGNGEPEPALEPAGDLVPKEDEPPPPPEAAAEPTKDEAVEKEIGELKLKDRSAERFRELSSKVKTLEEVAAEVETLRAANTQWAEAIKDTRAQPEEIGKAFAILYHANTGTPEGAKQALAMMDEFRTNLAQRFGIDLAGVDHLQGFDDLQAKVGNGDMELAAARELAALRRQQDEAARARQANAQQSEQEQAMHVAGAQVDALCEQLKAADPQYAQKYAVLKPLVSTIARTVPPAQWAATFKAYYDNLTLPALPNDPRTGAPAGPAPIRRSASAGGNQTPKTMLEAVQMEIG